MGRRWWILTVEMCFRFNTGEIVDFVVLDKVEFRAPKLKCSNSIALGLSKYDK